MRRSPELAPLSREHQVALERALRLRRADAGTAAEAVTAFVRFMALDGEAHFAAEEQQLGPDLTPAERARLDDEHRRLRDAAARYDADPAAVDPAEANATGELLNAHVRWEERELFVALEERLSPERLAAIGAALA